jgi:hypothetical protein
MYFRFYMFLGPSLLTASAREVILRQPNVSYRLAAVDFKDYGGRFKAVYVPVKSDPKHYMNMHKKKNSYFLSEYQPETPVTPQQLKDWQVLISHAMLCVYLMHVFLRIIGSGDPGPERQGDIRGGRRQKEGHSQLGHAGGAQLYHGGCDRALGRQDCGHRHGRQHA